MERKMKTEMLGLITAIEKGNSADIQEAFDNIMARKLLQRIQDMRNSISKNIFVEAADRAYGIAQEPEKEGVDPSDSESASVKVKRKKTSNPDVMFTEVLDPDAPASVWIHDFIQSKDPRFAGKSKKERQQMALGAWYAAQRKKKGE